MDLSQIRTVLSVARLGSITRAAAYLNISQPSLTRHVQLLEQELGSKLFHRDGHGMSPTPFGAAMLGRFAEILEKIDEIKQIARDPDAHSTMSGTVRIGVPLAISPLIARIFLTRCSDAYPNVSVQIVEGFSGLLHQWLVNSSIDLAILYGPIQAPGIQQTLIAVEDLCAIGAATHANRTRKEMSGDDLQNSRLILPHEPHFARDLIRQSGLIIKQVLEVDAMTMMLELARMGTGYAILPQISAQTYLMAGQLVAIPIRNPSITWTVSIAQARPARATDVATVIGDLLKAELQSAIVEGQWPARLVAEMEIKATT
jgi:LysR family transcriptional regulator, nitrogen assimilation regulatory protein